MENVLEELDSPGEWFHDPLTSTLYLYPNATTAGGDATAGTNDADTAPATVVAPTLSALIRIEGASAVTVRGLHFTETRATYMDPYEVPSGGDWAVHRGAALELVDARNVTVEGCTFEQVGGNGVLLSNAVVGSVIDGNHFHRTGDSAIVSVGTVMGMNGTAATFPDSNVISSNLMHEIGIFGKQTSCYFQALTARTDLRDNVCFNGPRAGINWNDGFFGGR